MTRSIWAGALLAAGALVAGRALPAETPLTAWAAALRQAEQEQGKQRISLTVTQRDAGVRSGETLDETRERLRNATNGKTTSTTMLTSSSGWRKETVVPAPPSSSESARTVVVAFKGTQRTLMEVVSPGRALRQGILANQAATTPGDALLAGHLSDYLEGFQWREQAERADQLEVQLQRGGEALSLSAPKAHPQQFSRIRLDRPLPGRDTGGRQVYEALIDYRGDQLRRIEEIVITPAPYAAVAWREMVVDGREPLADEPEIEGFRFPAGTVVRDVRFKSPVEYEQGEKDPSDDEIRKIADDVSQPPPSPGDTAPAFSLQNDRGEAVTLDTLKGKVVVFYWYAQWSSAAGQSVAQLEKDIYRKYKAKGVQVVGIQIGASPDPAAAARAYRQAHGLTFPILVDVSGATLRQLGPGNGVPQVTVLDRAGKVRYSATGWDLQGVTGALSQALSPTTGGAGAPVSKPARPKQGAR